jgi:hypothetical protein
MIWSNEWHLNKVDDRCGIECWGPRSATTDGQIRRYSVIQPRPSSASVDAAAVDADCARAALQAPNG